MSPAQTTLVVLALAAAVIDWVAIARGLDSLERIAKPLVMILLGAAVLVAGPGTDPVGAGAASSSASRWLAWGLLLAALAGSLAGDVLLLPPGRFVPGLSAFLVAQLAYLWRFLLAGPSALGMAIGGAIALAVAGVVGRGIARGAARAGLGPPVAVYLVAILLMAVAATAIGRPVVAIGAWLFVLADTALGWDHFARPGTPGADPAWRLASNAPYHVGQVLIVAGLLG